MGLWSRIKSVARLTLRLAVDNFSRLWHLPELVGGFLAWPSKKMRLHVVVLADQNGPVVAATDVDPSLVYIKRVFKDRFNVKVTPYSLSFVQVLKDPAPPAALDVGCDWRALKDDGGVAGSYFARYIAGWNVVPVSVVFPVTVFVVRDVGGKRGCSLGPLTDYITIDVSGVRDGTTMAHEVGHSCGLWHSATTANLMFHGASRGDQVKWFQRNVLRSSRHVTLF